MDQNHTGLVTSRAFFTMKKFCCIFFPFKQSKGNPKSQVTLDVSGNTVLQIQ